LNIGCPSDGCEKTFQDEQLKKLLNKADLEKYHRFKKAAILTQNPNLRWCVREGCDKYVIAEDGNRKLICECGTEICFKCGNQYHKKKSCNSVINEVYKKYAKEKNVQNCPYCRSRIEKADGCNHITCLVCSYQWCWLCRKKYTLDHYNLENEDGCPGLQNAINKPKKKLNFIDVSKQIMGFIGTILVFPFLLILSTMYLPNWLYDKHQEKKYGPNHKSNPNDEPGLRCLLSIIGVVAFPLLLGGFIIFGIIYLFVNLFRRPKRDFHLRRVQGNAA